jgi:hypothetical protein
MRGNVVCVQDDLLVISIAERLDDSVRGRGFEKFGNFASVRSNAAYEIVGHR